MSTARQADRRATAPPATPATPAQPATPRVTRTSIFPKGACPSPTATLPAVSLPATPFADWRGRAVTEELPAVPPYRVGRACRGTTVRRHLRAALAGTLLAIVAITGLSSYAAQGIAEARSTALCQAHISCR